MKVLMVLLALASLCAARPQLVLLNGLGPLIAPGSIAIAPPAPEPAAAPEPVKDTPEVAAARASHLAAVAEAAAKAAAAPAEPAPAPAAQAPAPVQDTPEVAAARASHLAAVEEARSRAANPAPSDPSLGPAVISTLPLVASHGLWAGHALPLALNAPLAHGALLLG